MTKRNFFAAAVLATGLALTGCGSSGDGGGGTASGVTGTIAGAAFTQAEAAAILATGNNCQISVAAGIPIGTTLAVVPISNATGVCAANTMCAYRKNSQTVYVIIARAHIGIPGGTSAAPGWTTGAYTFADLTNPAALANLTPDANNNVAIFTAGAVGLDGVCAPTPIQATGGTLNVTSADATGISGSVTVNFGTSGSVTGNFTSGTCPGIPTADACSVLTSILAGGSFGNPACTSSATCT